VKMLTRGGASFFAKGTHTVGPHWGGPCGSIPAPTSEEIELAKRRLEQFVFVGITDQWQMSMCLFHAITRSKCLNADFVDSRTKDGLDHPDYNAKAMLQNFTDPYDGALYSHALDLFNGRLREYNLSPEACKPCFDEAGVEFRGV